MDRELVQRLSKYKNVLQKLKSIGFRRVFSGNLGDALGISAALVRKDFSACKLTGHKRGGYLVVELLEKLNTLLGKNEAQDIVIVGCGKIGTALLNYNGFNNEGIRVVAGFDSDPDKINPDAPTPIYPVEKLTEVIRSKNVRVAVLTVPEEASHGIAERLRDAGVRGILNFTPVQLKPPPDCNVENVNIAFEVEKLFYLMNVADRKKEATPEGTPST
jgi:redox-sensing transcriptional repressor